MTKNLINHTFHGKVDNSKIPFMKTFEERGLFRFHSTNPEKKENIKKEAKNRAFRRLEYQEELNKVQAKIKKPSSNLSLPHYSSNQEVNRMIQRPSPVFMSTVIPRCTTSHISNDHPFYLPDPSWIKNNFHKLPSTSKSNPKPKINSKSNKINNKSDTYGPGAYYDYDNENKKLWHSNSHSFSTCFSRPSSSYKDKSISSHHLFKNKVNKINTQPHLHKNNHYNHPQRLSTSSLSSYRQAPAYSFNKAGRSSHSRSSKYRDQSPLVSHLSLEALNMMEKNQRTYSSCFRSPTNRFQPLSQRQSLQTSPYQFFPKELQEVYSESASPSPTPSSSSQYFKIHKPSFSKPTSSSSSVSFPHFNRRSTPSPTISASIRCPFTDDIIKPLDDTGTIVLNNRLSSRKSNEIEQNILMVKEF